MEFTSAIPPSDYRQSDLPASDRQRAYLETQVGGGSRDYGCQHFSVLYMYVSPHMEYPSGNCVLFPWTEAKTPYQGIPARLQISARYEYINNIWDRCEKIIFLMVDAALNWLFIRTVRDSLVRQGLTKYDRLVRFNQCIVGLSLAMDCLIMFVVPHLNFNTMFLLTPFTAEWCPLTIHSCQPLSTCQISMSATDISQIHANTPLSLHRKTQHRNVHGRALSQNLLQ